MSTRTQILRRVRDSPPIEDRPLIKKRGIHHVHQMREQQLLLLRVHLRLVERAEG